MTVKPEYPLVFEALKGILTPYAKKLTLKIDTPNSYSIDGPYSERFKKEIFFAAVQIKKNYVSYHLMPIYIFPELLKDTSPELKKRMQGKSCFNFKIIERDLFTELKMLTNRGYTLFIKDGIL